jgi:hypothetical protein
VSFEIFSKFNKVIGLLPKLDVAVDAEGNDEISLIGRNDVVNDVSVHVADLIQLGSWQTFEQQIVKLD